MAGLEAYQAATPSSWTLFATGVIVVVTILLDIRAGRTLRTSSAVVAELMTMPTWFPAQDLPYLLSLTVQKSLTVLLLDRIDDGIGSGLFVDIEKLWHHFDEKGESGHFGTFDMLVDRLTGSGDGGGDAGMSALDGSDASSVKLDVVIDPDAERAVWTTSAASTDALFVTVENVGCKVGFDSPFPQGFLEVGESREALIFHNRRHDSLISPR